MPALAMPTLLQTTTALTFTAAFLSVTASTNTASPTPHSPTPQYIPSSDPGWPQFRGPRRDGVSDETGLLQNWPESGPRLLWSAKGIGRGYSSPIIVNNSLFVTGDFDTELHILAFDLQGQPLWRATNGLAWFRPYPGARSSVTFNNGRLYHQNARGRLACLDAETGNEIWATNVLEQFGSQNITWGLSECLLVDQHAVFVTVGGPNTLLVALDKLTGNLIWKSKPLLNPDLNSEPDLASYASPILVQFGNHRLILACSLRHLFCADADTGIIYDYQPRPTTHSVIAMMPTLVRDGVFTTAPHGLPGTLYNLLPSTSPDGPVSLQPSWTTPLDTAQGSVVHANDRIFGSFYPARKGWAAIDAANGNLLYQSPNFAKGALLYADQHLYTLCEDGWMLLLRPTHSAFELHGRFRFANTTENDAWAHPVILHGRLYLRYHDSLSCYDIRGNH
jgi:outer membrane protein assembly factor BamB